ncbi:branched-chain amino acid ABC transporter permease [Rhabdaerophilum calidifontis]|uniref:branched-chain amino acid ABC transporter permease n=1 Tax=Rhabdaerophilum calidifontis TaxID=2604328 RepID=UPI0012390C95|nr:branched-chain amino acid ABC transporter permease [Rhabdaerophilum calidifontis]
MRGPMLNDRIRARLAASRRWHPAEFVLWGLALAAVFLLPRQLLILNEIAILALFAISLDLILGYAGLVSLGHAAFLGVGAYAAGLLAIHVTADPLAGLAFGTLAAALAGLVTCPLVLKGNDLTRLMVTLGISMLLLELANSFGSITGGADGLQGITMAPLLGLFEFDLMGRTAYLYSLAVLFLLFLLARRIVHSPFGLSLRAIRDNPLRAAAAGVPATRRLTAVYTLAAAYAGAAGALLAQTTQFVSLDVLAFHRSADLMLVLIIGGAGYLYGGIIGALAFKILQDAIATVTPQYWQFWIGLLLVLFVLGGREILHGGVMALVRRGAALFSRRRKAP